MLSFLDKTVYLCCGYTDMRKSINGLAELVQSSFNLDPFAAAIFVFCNKNRDRVKILEWDVDGFWLYFKRLEKGHFRWPSASAQRSGVPQVGDEPTMVLSEAEFNVLLSSVRVELKIKRKEVIERNIS